ncbi:exonuclease 1-like [Malaya genurostris]|uniref:exonuclease 1-like n=1 Tax=Malaya genurostris TaxID=325434 RepID=UPI0026F3B2C8|nr:exonuclease 1-like [Malaya genurostris]
MGITGLIPFLEKASNKTHLRDLRGQCVAIDSYCWLHKGAFACADKLARGDKTDSHIQYCLKYINLLLSHDIKPILVFDGRHLPAKAATEAKRRESRESSKKKAAELLRNGQIEEAKSYLRRCVDITHEMALQLIQECRKRNIDCVVAPHEADAQLAYLHRKGIAQAIVTEDSDLMLFGCSKVLFKLDLTGYGLLIESDKLYLAMGCKEEKYSFDKFRYMCILSGCDYIDSLPGIGLAKARKFVLMTEESDMRKALDKIPSYLNMRHLTISEEYKTNFLKADATFKHMVVYDPTNRTQIRLNDPDSFGTDLDLCCNAGTFLDNDTAFQLALGNIDPFSMKKLDNWHPDDPSWKATGGQTADWKQTSIAKHVSIWKSNYVQRKPSPVKIQENLTIRNVFKQSETVKRPVPNPDFENAEKNQSIDDVLELYGIKPNEQPPLKKLCMTMSSESRRKTIDFEEIQVLDSMAALENSPSKPTVRRNPFQVASIGPISIIHRSSATGMLSPTKITPETSSLLRNVSPVKRLEFDSNLTSEQNVTKCEKLSRFKRTVTKGDRGQKVISRFFSASSSSTTTCQSITEYQSETKDSVEVETSPLAAASVYLLSPEAKPHHRGEQTPKKQKPSLIREEFYSSPDPPVKSEPPIQPVDSGFVEEPDVGLSSSQKENESTDMNSGTSSRIRLFVKAEPSQLGGSSAKVGKDEDDTVEEKSSPQEENRTEILHEEDKAAEPDSSNKSGTGSTQKKSAACRRMGLSKVKKLKDVGPTQSKLSMFGFQKKVQLTGTIE